MVNPRPGVNGKITGNCEIFQPFFTSTEGFQAWDDFQPWDDWFQLGVCATLALHIIAVYPYIGSKGENMIKNQHATLKTK